MEPNKNVENYVIVSIIAAGYSIITIYTFFVKWELFQCLLTKLPLYGFLEFDTPSFTFVLCRT